MEASDGISMGEEANGAAPDLSEHEPEEATTIGEVGEGEEFPPVASEPEPEPALAEEPESEDHHPEEEDIAPAGSIEDLAANGEEAKEVEEEPEPLLPGLQAQLSLNVGGEPPTRGTMKLVGGSVDVEGEYPKGARITFTVEARVGEVAFVDKMDNAGYVKSTERRHTARIESVRLND